VSFASFGLPTPILKGIRAAGITEANAIQTKSIPVVLQGMDLIGVAESGSGKTGAYVIPTLARLLDRSARLRGLIVTPTRELASYIETRARDYARFTEIKVGVVYTGGPLSQQEKMLREQPINLLVATPGRLLELHARGCLNFEDVELLVLEEADRMVALGFAPDLRKLLKLLPETRQTLLFTLTMPPELNRLAKEALVEPVRIDVAPAGKPETGITQAVYPVRKELKATLLEDLLSRSEVRSTIIVTRARTSADRLARQLQRRAYAVAVLDDGPSQGQRDQAVEDLKRGRVQVLIASEAAARSLDTAGTAHVVNFDVPHTPEDYVHRLGRTGRGEPVGDAFTLMSPEEQKDLDAVEQFLGRAIPRVMLPDFDYAMDPREIKQVPSFNERGLGRSGSGIAAAAARISKIKGSTDARTNGSGDGKRVPSGAKSKSKKSATKKPQRAASPAKAKRSTTKKKAVRSITKKKSSATSRAVHRAAR